MLSGVITRVATPPPHVRFVEIALESGLTASETCPFPESASSHSPVTQVHHIPSVRFHQSAQSSQSVPSPQFPSPLTSPRPVQVPIPSDRLQSLIRSPSPFLTPSSQSVPPHSSVRSPSSIPSPFPSPFPSPPPVHSPVPSPFPSPSVPFPPHSPSPFPKSPSPFPCPFLSPFPQSIPSVRSPSPFPQSVPPVHSRFPPFLSPFPQSIPQLNDYNYVCHASPYIYVGMCYRNNRITHNALRSAMCLSNPARRPTDAPRNGPVSRGGLPAAPSEHTALISALRGRRRISGLDHALVLEKRLWHGPLTL
nr:vegetative cell wall protein gp1-like [Penaeus vannamei]